MDLPQRYRHTKTEHVAGDVYNEWFECTRGDFGFRFVVISMEHLWLWVMKGKNTRFFKF